jgi:hypothetical protein
MRIHLAVIVASADLLDECAVAIPEICICMLLLCCVAPCYAMLYTLGTAVKRYVVLHGICCSSSVWCNYMLQTVCVLYYSQSYAIYPLTLALLDESATGAVVVS